MRRYPFERTLEDDMRDLARPPDPTEHVHFHEHNGSRHAHSHSHAAEPTSEPPWDTALHAHSNLDLTDG